MKAFLESYFTINKNNWSSTVNTSLKVGLGLGLVGGILLFIWI